MTILLFEPDSDSGEFNEAHEVDEQLIISGCDASELFELVEEALDEIALLVEVDVVGALNLAIALGRDDDLRAFSSNCGAQMVGVVAFVGDGHLRVESPDEIMRESDIVALTGRGDQPERIAERVAGGVDFGA